MLTGKYCKDSFIIRYSWLESLQNVSDADFKEMVMAMLNFSKSGESPCFEGFKKVAWQSFEDALRSDAEKYFAMCERNKVNGSLGGQYGKLGGRPRKTPNGDIKPPETPNGDIETPDGGEKPPKTPDIDIDYDYIKEKNIYDIPKEKPSANAPASSFAKQKGFKSWDELDFRKNVDDAVKEDPNLGTFSNEFCEYWTEKTSSGKMRFQTEKTWETPKRLVRWKNNSFSKCLDDSKDAGLSKLPTAEQLLATEGNYD